MDYQERTARFWTPGQVLKRCGLGITRARCQAAQTKKPGTDGVQRQSIPANRDNRPEPYRRCRSTSVRLQHPASCVRVSFSHRPGSLFPVTPSIFIVLYFSPLVNPLQSHSRPAGGTHWCTDYPHILWLGFHRSPIYSTPCPSPGVAWQASAERRVVVECPSSTTVRPMI